MANPLTIMKGEDVEFFDGQRVLGVGTVIEVHSDHFVVRPDGQRDLTSWPSQSVRRHSKKYGVGPALNVAVDDILPDAKK